MILRVVHEKPGFFLTDVPVDLALDGYTYWRASFLQGFVVDCPIAPGPHVLATRLELGVFGRTREYRLEIPPPDASGDAVWIAKLDYSRLWGNFSKKLSMSRANV
jgi:hypothetical protein